MNWEMKIIAGMLIFITFIVTLGWIMLSSKPDGLVDSNYYEKGLKYEGEFNMKEQTIKDGKVPEILLTADILTIRFKTDASGMIKMMCVADKSKDRVLNFKTNENKQVGISTGGLTAGLWRLEISWKDLEAKYLYDKEVVLP